MDVLAGISPWWWIALAILLAAAEMLTVTTVLMGAAAAAALTGVALWLAPDLGGAAQVALFGVLAIAFTFLGRYFVARYGDGAQPTRLNQRAEQLIGREAVVLGFSFDEGRVQVDGVQWPARLEGGGTTPAAGDRVRVVSTDGIVVRVKAI